jgi:hypothetical protein
MTLPIWRNAAGTQRPNLFTSVDGTYQVGLWIRTDWDVQVIKRSLITGQIIASQNLGLIPALVSYGITPINSDATGGDVHWGIAGMLDSLNRIWIGGNSLSTPGHQAYSASNSLSSWTTLTWPFPGMPQSAGASLTGANQITYHHYNRLSTGDMLWAISQRDESGAAEGIDYLGFYMPPGTTAWVPLVDNGEILTSDLGPPERIYFSDFFVEQFPHKDRVWMWGFFRFDWTDVTTQHSPWIIYNDTVKDQNTWKRIDGTPQPMPLTWNNVNGTSAIFPQVTGTYWYSSGQLCIDRAGHPHVIHEARPAGPSRHVWHDGTAWQDAAAGTASSTPSPFPTRDGGVGFYREFGGRQRISAIGGGVTVDLGPPVPTNWDCQFFDPIQASQGNLHLLMGDGDNPEVHTFGPGTSRVKAS